MINFFIPGKPTGKGRPRVCRNVTYTPKETKDYETLVRTCYKQKYSNKEPIPAKNTCRSRNICLLQNS